MDIVSVQITFTPDERVDILTTAAEGGITYWADAISVARRDPDAGVTRLTVFDEEGDGGTIFVNDSSLDDAANKVLAGPLIETKRQLLASIETNDLDLDAEAADVLVQIALLGEIVYG